MSFAITFFTECSRKVGTGHFVESVNLLKGAREKGFKCILWTTDTTPVSITNDLSIECNFYNSNKLKDEIPSIKKSCVESRSKVMVFNLRNITNDALSLFDFDDIKHICIDELGNKHLDCDVIINPLIGKNRHKYFSNNKRLDLYAGPCYLSISPKIQNAPCCKNYNNSEIKTVSVCMGGVDRSGATLKLIDVLADWKPEVRKKIIVGAAFAHLKEVRKKIDKLKKKNYEMFHNVNDIGSIFSESDVVFTAGGNVLYELACMGIPAIVLYEDEHEMENGVEFEKKGFGICVGSSMEASNEDILNALLQFNKCHFRYFNSIRGRELVDGKGMNRVLDIISNLCNEN